MTKRKILLLAMSLCMVAILAVGGTLAYFTDTDAQTNVFTVGHVAIDLFENFGDNDETGIEDLTPVTYNEDGTRRQDNVVTKEVYVENTGSKDAYVRVHIAIPQILDDGADTFDASANILHFNFEANNAAAGGWDWSDTPGAPYTGEWNYYETKIGDIVYNVYVVTHEPPVTPGEVTGHAMSQVYMDSDVTNADVTRIKETLGDEWKIYVVAEAGQVEGFYNAHEALDTQFGVPGKYTVNFTADPEGKTQPPQE